MIYGIVRNFKSLLFKLQRFELVCYIDKPNNEEMATLKRGCCNSNKKKTYKQKLWDKVGADIGKRSGNVQQMQENQQGNYQLLSSSY